MASVRSTISFFAELLANLVIVGIRSVRLGNQSQRLGPRQSGPLAFGVEGRLTPGIEFVQPLFRLAHCARILGMHVNAVRAAIDLRSAHLDQMNQLVIKPAFGDIFLQRIQRFLRFRCVFPIVNSRFHEGSPSSRAMPPRPAPVARPSASRGIPTVWMTRTGEWMR